MACVVYAQSADAGLGEVDLADVRRARHAIRPYVRPTPVVRSGSLSRLLGTNVYLKLEVFQKTGAFKVRGAFNRMLSAPPNRKSPGFVAVSGGNHAQAVAHAARVLGRRAKILMPRVTPRNYIDATRDYGAEVLVAESLEDAFEAADQLSADGWDYVHPFDDPLVIAGQGTLGLEIVEQLPCVTDIVLSIGGGGLAAGVATAAKAVRPGVRVWGAETEGAAGMSRSLAAKRVVRLDSVSTIARTLAVACVGTTTFRMVRRLVDGVVVVSDEDAVRALWHLLERTKILTEPAASVTLAAAERMKGRFRPDDHVVLILCGGNAALSELIPASAAAPA